MMHQQAPYSGSLLDELYARSLTQATASAAGRSPKKLALVVEGGAMRGIISMAFLTALHKHNMHRAFDRVFAASAGAINAAYFLAGQAETALSFYLEAAKSTHLFRKWPPWSMLNLDALFEGVREGQYALQCDSLRASSTRMDVFLTKPTDGSSVSVPLEGTDDRILNILKATSAIIPYYNKLVEVDGKPFLDGGISEPIPIRSAIDEGCTHLLVLLTRPASHCPRKLTVAENAFLRLSVLPRTAEFRRMFLHRRRAHYEHSRAAALGASKANYPVDIFTITPPEGLRKVHRFANRVEDLEEITQECIKYLSDLIDKRASRNQPA
jgi:predicted patatin/cPLA2 family phospholipase